jgi:hypothetical protein
MIWSVLTTPSGPPAGETGCEIDADDEAIEGAVTDMRWDDLRDVGCGDRNAIANELRVQVGSV